MDPTKQAEELLREAACFGDEETVKTLITAGVNVNVQHSLNGWTPLHWATKRGHLSVVKLLLSAGADSTIAASRGEKPLDVVSNDEIRLLLTSGKCDMSTDSASKAVAPLPIVPNYLAHPPLAHKVEIGDVSKCTPKKSDPKSEFSVSLNEELVVKVRTSNPTNQDFIEVEVPYKDLSFAALLKVCCDELEVNRQKVVKLRKLPNTILRKDKDVLRLVNFVELELVLLPDEYLDFSMTNGYAKSYTNPEINGFIKNNSAINRSVRNGNNGTNMFQKSSICKDGVILY